MSEMVDRVAEALKTAYRAGGRHSPNPQLDDDIDAYIARAAIAAMREPTQAMVDAPGNPYNRHEFENNWKAMIDEALR
jgi:hypothetical protein